MTRQAKHGNARGGDWYGQPSVIAAFAIFCVLAGCSRSLDKSDAASSAAQDNVATPLANQDAQGDVQANSNSEPEVVRSTFKINHLERFRPLPPRSTVRTPDLESEEAKARLATLSEERESQKTANIERVVMNPDVASAWLGRMAKLAASDGNLLKPLEGLRAGLCPSREVMAQRFQERKIDMSGLDQVALEREYRKVFSDELRGQVRQFADLTEKTGL